MNITENIRLLNESISSNEKLLREMKSVGITQQEILDMAYSFSVGMGIVENYRQAEKCVKNVSALYLRFAAIVTTIQQPAASIDVYSLWLESALSLGNISTTYKGCYTSTEGSIYQFYYQIMQYKSITNYLLYLLPNMLSYAFVVNNWITRM